MMIRETLVIFSLIGLVLSVGLWTIQLPGPIRLYANSNFIHLDEGYLTTDEAYFLSIEPKPNWPPDGKYLIIQARDGSVQFKIVQSPPILEGVRLHRPPPPSIKAFERYFPPDTCVRFSYPIVTDLHLPLWLPILVFSLFAAHALIRRMLRNIRTIPINLWLIGLLLSVGLWIMSYVGVSYTGRSHVSILQPGGIVVFRLPPQSPVVSKPSWIWGGIAELRRTKGERTSEIWIPRFYSWPGSWQVRFPLWIPTLAFGTFVILSWHASFHRRRKRKKLGLCLNCGYSLHGLPEPRCPECGTEFDEKLLKGDSAGGTRPTSCR